MTKRLKGFLFCILISSFFSYGSEPVTLELSHNYDVIPNQIKLSDKDILWLSQKRTLTIAIFPSESFPLALNSGTGRYRGMNADYLALLQKTLNVKVILKFYPDKQQALSAVQTHHADLMLTQFVSSKDINNSFIKSKPLVQAYPTLVTTQEKTMQPLYSKETVTVAITGSYPPDSFIKMSFPQAKIISYSSDYDALSSVMSGNSNYFIGNNLSTSTLIAQEFNQSLSMVKFWKQPQICNCFIALSSQEQLINIMDDFIGTITDQFSNQVTQSWIEDGNLSFLTQPISLSSQEMRWLKKAPRIRVLVNPYYAPFTMLDSSLEIRGLVGDILNLINLQTGLEFEPVVISSSSDTYQEMKEGNWDLQAAVTYSEERENSISFTHPYLTTYYVAVVKNTSTPISVLSPGMKIAISRYHALYEKLKTQYPNIEWVQVENSSVGLNMVESGKVDASIYTQLSARYMIDHYYPNKLTYFRIPDEELAEISFAVPRSSQELRSILNKALDDIPPKEISRLVGKWTKMPNIQIDTWDLYNKQFYVVLFLAGLLIFSSLLWGFYLTREIRIRRQYQSDLEYQLNFRHTLANAIPIPNYIISLEGVLDSYNNAFSIFFSEKLREEFKRSLFDSRHPLSDIYSVIRHDIDGRLTPNTVITHPLMLNNGDEERHILHWLTLCSVSSDMPSVIICGWQDITESKQLMGEIQIEKEKAIQSNLAKSTFLASMSHEIRTPISSIMGFLELLASNTQKIEEDKESIQLAYSTAQSLLGLIGNVLDMEKIESGHFELTPEWVDLESLLTAIVRTFEGLAMQKKLRLTFINRLENGTLLWLDPQAIRQAMSNLISNAIKFTSQGSIDIYAEENAEGGDKNKLILKVTDTGTGISLQDQQQLFKPFSQTQVGKKQTGSGLGLMICRQLVQRMEGHINIVSQLDQGTSITITLPASFLHDKKVTIKTLSEPKNQMPKGLKILIADDHPTNRLLLKRQLSNLGYQVDEAIDGVMALGLIRENTYDLLITDINMPNMDGIALTRHVRILDKHIHIWGLTANAQAQERERCLAEGMNLCLFKPLTLQQLESSLSLLNLPRVSCRLKELVNLDMLNKLTMDDSILLCQMLDKSSQENFKDLILTKEAICVDDRPKLYKHLHRIKGTAQILGATRLQELCERIERYSSKQFQTSRVKDDLIELENFLQILRDEINRFCR